MRKNRNVYGILVMKYPEVREFFGDTYTYWRIILKLILVNV